MTITTACANSVSTSTYMSAKPVWERVRADCRDVSAAKRAQCVAQSTWHEAFATHLVTRFGTVFHQLRDAARR